MASVPQSSWFCTLRPTNGTFSPTKPKPRNFSFNPPKSSSSSSNAEPSPPNSPNPPENSSDPLKLAFAKAKAYKESLQSNPVPKIVQNPVSESAKTGNKNGGSVSEVVNNGGNEKVPLSVKVAMEKAKEYKKSKEIIVASGGVDEKSESFSDGLGSEVTTVVNEEVPASLKLAMEKAKEYKKSKEIVGAGLGSKKDGLGSEVTNVIVEEVPASVKLAMEKAKEYQKNERDMSSAESQTISGNALYEKMVATKDDRAISSIDFMGLGFADKKNNRGLPAGLVPVSDPFPEGDLPEVEIIVGNSSMFGKATVSEPKSTEEDKAEVYKPKVSTWGVFPRPSNISKTYGGGRNIRPGEVLETAEDKAAKDSRTRELLAAYRRKRGLSIDPKLKSECEKALKDGDTLMDLGKLKEALPFYETVMDKIIFQSELHGLAALQWSICQDSLSRRNEARVMYEKLQSHPNVRVSKTAKQFLFGFQAMEMMKVKSTTLAPINVGYQDYFEAFVEDKAHYTSKDDEVEEGVVNQALPYIIFLATPIFIVLLIPFQKGL